MTKDLDLTAGESVTLIAVMTALLKAITELVKVLRRRERADARLLDLED